MAKMKLYEIAGRLRDLDEALAEMDGELTPEIERQLDEWGGALHVKAHQVALLAREARVEAEALAGKAKAIRDEANRVMARAKAAERREDSLKEYIRKCMEAAGVERIDGDVVKMRRQRNPSPSITWLGEVEEIPTPFRRVVMSLDYRAASDAVKASEAGPAALPEGFRVEYGEHLRIW